MSDGLRITLHTQARRLTDLAARRLDELGIDCQDQSEVFLLNEIARQEVEINGHAIMLKSYSEIDDLVAETNNFKREWNEVLVAIKVLTASLGNN